MKEEILHRWKHSHSIGQDQQRPGEIRTFIVITITITITTSMMLVEIVAGIACGSMALLAGDLHIWTVGPGIYSAVISIVSRSPENPDHYKSLIPDSIRLHPVSVEVHKYTES